MSLNAQGKTHEKVMALGSWVSYQADLQPQFGHSEIMYQSTTSLKVIVSKSFDK